MATLSNVIMAHPKREKWVPELQNKLSGSTVIWDEQDSRWDTGRRALLAYPEKATHHLIVQDDAILSKDFLRSCKKLIEHSGDLPVDLYMGSSAPGYRRKMMSCKSNGTPWFAAAGPKWGVAVILPTAHIPAIVEFGDKDRKTEAYDGKMALYYIRKKISCLYTAPSLVDHREVHENPSLMPNRLANRTAFWYTGESALHTDWTILPDYNPTRIKSKFVHRESGKINIVTTYGDNYKKLKNSKEWEMV